jgi:endonuclease/exonuclease/phosphatase family metal-dependent hydrolase
MTRLLIMRRSRIQMQFLTIAVFLGASGPPSWTRQTHTDTYVRLSAPELLTYADCVELLRVDPPAGRVAEKLHQILTTPFISNEAYHKGLRPAERNRPELGTFLRVGVWNIERGLRLDEIILALKDPAGFQKHVVENTNRPETLQQTLEEASAFSQSDVMVLTEVDYGVPRTDYTFVANKLADALQMNYVYGTEFVEIDPWDLDLETFDGIPEEERQTLLREFEVDKDLYHGLHGTAVLSRYPIRSARLVPFHDQPHDWYHQEIRKGDSTSQPKDPSAVAQLLLRKAGREVRRGGRMMLLVELDLAGWPQKTVTMVATHLEDNCKPQGRQRQMQELLHQIQNVGHPVILAGDFNTSGKDRTPISPQRMLYNQVGYKNWLKLAPTIALGVSMPGTLAAFGVGGLRSLEDPTVRDIFLVSQNSERRLFTMLEDMRFTDGGVFDFRGDSTRSSNQRQGALANSNQRGAKGFEPTFELDHPLGPFGKFKLDWIVVKGHLKDPKDKKGSYQFAPHFGRTLKYLNQSVPNWISDHNAMIADLPRNEPPQSR